MGRQPTTDYSRCSVWRIWIHWSMIMAWDV